jgi:hypothetical protein
MVGYLAVYNSCGSSLCYNGSAIIGYYLKQNYPNPFMKTTTIEFRLPVESKVDIEFSQYAGKTGRILLWYFNAGIHSVEITLTQELQPGVYFYG